MLTEHLFGKRLYLMLLIIMGGWASLPTHAAVILQYHHISDETPDSTSTSVKRFTRHLEYLDEHQFDVVALPALISGLKRGQAFADKTVAITFDDGYRSVYDTAFPLLREHGFAFTVFVNSAPIDQGSEEFVTWPELQEMSKAGATIANHTMSHPYMVRLLPDETDAQWRERITAEITGAEQAIASHIDQSVKLLAYPYGEFDESLKALLQELGFAGFGQHSGPVGVDSDVLALPRFPMGGDFGAQDSFITKINTRALPIKRRQLMDDQDKPLQSAVVVAGSRPRLQLTLDSPALAARLTCYLGGKELSVALEDATVTVMPAQALKPGRSRYNCTARADDGRYYWFSQPWLVTGEQGQWQHES